MFSSRVTPDSYHSTLSPRDSHVRVFSSLEQHNFSANTASLFRSHRNSGYLHGSLTPTQKFWITPRVSYTHTEILDNSTGLLHPRRNFGFLHGSLTPSHKFRISPRVSYTLTEISDFSTGLLHPHRNLGRLLGSLTPIQKSGISLRVSYTHTEIRDLSPGLLHPHRNSGSLPGSLTPILQASHLKGLTTPLLLCPTHFNYSSFPDSNYESSLDVVPKINSSHTHQEW